jgi:sulfur relay (sulfurtransferase) DsrF/TusC family protein
MIFLLSTTLLISCSKYRLYKDAIIIYKSGCNEYLIQLSEGPYYLDTLLKPEYLEDKFKIDLLEVELVYTVSDSLTSCNLQENNPVISINNIINRR